MGGVAYGVVLRPDPSTSKSLIALSRTIGTDHDPLMLLGEKAPPHISVLHVDCPAEEHAGIRAATEPYRGRTFQAKIIGLLYAVVAPGDYYVPAGGHYFGLEIIRTPELDALHQRFLRLGHRPLGLVDHDYRPHITLGMSAAAPSAPPFAEIPAATITVTIAGGPVGPFGTFPDLV